MGPRTVTVLDMRESTLILSSTISRFRAARGLRLACVVLVRLVGLSHRLALAHRLSILACMNVSGRLSKTQLAFRCVEVTVGLAGTPNLRSSWAWYLLIAYVVVAVALTLDRSSSTARRLLMFRHVELRLSIARQVSLCVKLL